MQARSILLIFLVAFSLIAQEFRGTIQGEVLDATGASVAGAKVVATSVERQVSVESETNDSGRYVVQGLLPGRYILTIEKAGFRSFRTQEIALATGDRLGINATLEVGSTADSVTVTTDAPLLQTEGALRSTLIENRLIENLPSAGRNLYQLQYTLPGVVKTSNYWGSFELYASGNINAVSINGGRRGENETTLDGLSNTRADRGVSFVPALQAVQEFTTVTNIYDAQYGRVGGGVTQITLKSGTNALHGQLYEFLKNDALNANAWEANAAGVARSPFKNHTYGFEVNGPVYLPKLFDGRNKMFFLVSFEALREPGSHGVATSVPTSPMIQGDFSELRARNGAPITIFDPRTTVLGADGKYTRSPFPGNRIPTNRIDPASAAIARYFPAPNRATGPDHLDNYGGITPADNSYDQWLGKIDLRPSDRHAVAFRYGQTPWFNVVYNYSNSSPAESSTEFPSTRIPRNWGGSWDYTISPSLIFNLRAGLARYEGFSGNNLSQGFDPAQLGFSREYTSQLGFFHFPAIRFGSNYAPIAADRITDYETRDTYSIQPSVSANRGRHFFKLGFELRQYNFNRLQPGLGSGTFQFDRVWTQADPLQGDAASGNDFASFLLGHPSSGRVDRNIDPAYRNRYLAFFLQDDWKITSNLSLNLGLRWDLDTPVQERYNRMLRGFAFGQPSPLGNDLTGGLLYAGSDGSQREASNRDYNNWQPRIGLAWAVTPKWVLRAGYGLTYLGQSYTGENRGFSRSTPLVRSTDGNLTPAVSLSNPFPASVFPQGLLQPIGSSQGLLTDVGQRVGAQFLDRRIPKSHQISFGFQRQLGATWLADVSYVGNRTRQLPVSLNLNAIPATELTRLPVGDRPAYFSAQVPNALAGRLPGSRFNGATIPRSQALVRYPHFEQVTIAEVPIGLQDYHSLQMLLKKRFSGGLSAQFAYTWSKALEEASTLNDQDVNPEDLTATPLERRLVEFDVTHNFSAVGSYELPFGRGRRFGTQWNPVIDGVAGGWSLSTQWVLHSGFPMPFPNAGPIRPGSSRLNNAQRDERATAAGRPGWDAHQDPWFDTSFFPTRAQAPFTLRDFPTRFSDVRGTRRNVWEFSVAKSFAITETIRFQLRGDFNNAFNTPFWPRLRGNDVQDSRFGTMRFDPQNQTRVIVLAAKLTF